MPVVGVKDLSPKKKKKRLMGFFAYIYFQQCIYCSAYAVIIILYNSLANIL